jgi:hypothetical protein
MVDSLEEDDINAKMVCLQTQAKLVDSNGFGQASSIAADVMIVDSIIFPTSAQTMRSVSGNMRR